MLGAKVRGRTVGDQSSDVFRCSTDHGYCDGLVVSCAGGTLARESRVRRALWEGCCMCAQHEESEGRGSYWGDHICGNMETWYRNLGWNITAAKVAFN